MENEDRDFLKLLFEEQHRQLVQKRQKIHATSEKMLALFAIIAGWLVLAKSPLTPRVHWVIIGAVIIFAISSCLSVYTNNRSYYTIARTISKINKALGLFQKGKFLPNEFIYPAAWENFGERGEFRGAFFHIMSILTGAVLCIVAAFLRVE